MSTNERPLGELEQAREDAWFAYNEALESYAFDAVSREELLEARAELERTIAAAASSDLQALREAVSAALPYIEACPFEGALTIHARLERLLSQERGEG